MSENKNIIEKMRSIRNIVKNHPDSSGEQYADFQLAVIARNAMETKLDEAREKGKHGWHDKEVCSVGYLKKLLEMAMIDGEWVDVMNFAAMIYIREIADNG